MIVYPLLPVLLILLQQQKHGGCLATTVEQDTTNGNIYNDLQPLAYRPFNEAGSGEGSWPSSSSSQFGLQSSDVSSSSVSPSLITAKCWNNYENDNDCKHLNVITASSPYEQEQLHQNQKQAASNDDDDSIITPVVIFESASSIEPPHQYQSAIPYNSKSKPSASSGGLDQHQKPTNYLSAPTFVRSSTSADGNSAVLTRHRMPPPMTANDVYAAPPAGATRLPPDSSGGSYNRWPQLEWGPTTERSPTVENPPAITMPPTSVFVATPRPKKQPKTTTAGRRCRDENDADCDEPEENGDVSGGDDNDADVGGDDDEDNAIAGDRVTPLAGDLDDTEERRGQGQLEMGSGDRPADDNDDDGDDDGDDDDQGEDSAEDENYDESSGASEPPSPDEQGAPRFVDVVTDPVETTALPPLMPKLPVTRVPDRLEDTIGVSTTSRLNGAEIEVVVHPTMPPIFPVTMTSSVSGGGNGGFDSGGSFISSNEDRWPQAATTTSAPTTTTTATIMPDDTYKSKPVFPSTSLPDDSLELGNSLDSSNSQQKRPGETSGSSSEGVTGESPPTTTEIDLATFKPVPMPPVEPKLGQRWPSEYFKSQTQNGSSSETAGGQPESDRVADRHKFVAGPVPDQSPGAAGPPQMPTSQFRGQQSLAQREQQRFEGAWREKPVRPTGQQASGGGEPWAPVSHHLRPAQSSGDPMAPTQPRVQSEMLSTMLLYASIVILAVTATIFCLMASAFWRRNSLRQMHKAAMMNGAGRGPAGGANQMVGSLSHGGQLMANIQQPGLLSTYAAGKTLGMGKVTTSLATKPPDEGQLIEEDEDVDSDRVGGQDKNGQDDATNSDQANGQLEQAANGGSSWSTSNDEQTTASSGSQRTNDSQPTAYQPPQQQQQQQMHQRSPAPPNHQHQVAAGGRVHYPNSLSDGRQNSGSISDSQGSSVGIPQTMPTDARGAHPQQYPLDSMGYPRQQQQHHQGPIYDPNQGLPQGSYNPPVIRDGLVDKRFGPSHSVDGLQQQELDLHLDQEFKQPCGPAPGQPPKLIDNGARLPQVQQPPSHLGIYPPQVNGSPSNRLQFGHNNGNQYNPPTGSNDNYLINGHQQAPPLRLAGGPNNDINNNNISMEFNNGGQFSGPASPARVAMNPLATLGRRYPPGTGLNRNIFSEDSSSLMTASPSLARTSSSSSFAFNGSQHPTPSSIRAKHLVDAAGRVFNDYTQQAGPPILSRKDRSEAWYV